ncbi:hypothetical protein [Pseudomonas sp.]|uniref:hypothetical protein n=1 Tax=Pseudomonas sp. TaxID=306 RepID=UPI00258D30E9|nr:hypothetical protein [Pseudomonas sp.]
MALYHPHQGTYDAQLTADMRLTQNAVVGWLLMASWCYYIEPVPCSLLSDTQFDKACAWLLRHYDSVTHKYKYLLPREALAAGTGYHITAGQYPQGIVLMAKAAKERLENEA